MESVNRRKVRAFESAKSETEGKHENEDGNSGDDEKFNLCNIRRLMKRYQVQFQKDCHLHSETNNLEQAEYYARSLANWNLAAQVYDRSTRAIIFRTCAYAEKKQLGLMDPPPRKSGEFAELIMVPLSSVRVNAK